MNELMVPEVNEKGLGALSAANALSITSNEDYLRADAFIQDLKKMDKEVDGAFDEAIEAAFKAHRTLTTKKKQYAEPIAQARVVVKAKMNTWAEAQERLRREEEDRQRAAEKKRAEDEALRKAEEAEKSGDKKAAEEILSAPVETAPVVIPKSVPKVSTVLRTVWDFRLDATKLPREYLMPDTQKIGQIVRAMKDKTNIPGVEVFSRKV